MQEDVFYDPFLNFFRAADKHEDFPDFEWIKLILHHILMFSLNLILSLVVHFMFKNRRWTVQAAVLMLMVFAMTLPIYPYPIRNWLSFFFLYEKVCDSATYYTAHHSAFLPQENNRDLGVTY